ncbi:hypothetical protein GCM10023149_01190 [Mucilaginibacter gynuensis]|uniref:Activator of Hsp90 ATPase homologue 1/2-like C-terminal domain-containing protein n=1 Tax=Mucilaginibacter gynuensis TaxID=1302236 RepID=A0ABP8FNB7_9SPHI
MTDQRWTKFSITADFTTDVRTIYNAWTTQAGLEHWFLRKAEFYAIAGRTREADEHIKKEDSYFWQWHGYTDDVNEKGEILEANDSDLIKFTFTKGSVVTIDLQRRNGLTLLELTHENIPIEEDPLKNLYVQCQVGWTFYLANLKSIIAGGPDLRNRRYDIPSIFK